jgi:multiple RNA-binding domain-containing protein 1
LCLSQIKEERLRQLFGGEGTITDCALKYTQDGVFRKFAFIGFQTDAEAAAAVKNFNQTFVDTSRIQVTIILYFMFGYVT